MEFLNERVLIEANEINAAKEKLCNLVQSSLDMIGLSAIIATVSIDTLSDAYDDYLYLQLKIDFKNAYNHPMYIVLKSTSDPYPVYINKRYRFVYVLTLQTNTLNRIAVKKDNSKIILEKYILENVFKIPIVGNVD